MSFGALDHPGSFTRGHALLLTCACVVLLLLSLPSQKNWGTFNWSNSKTAEDETQIDAALQQAADEALGQREGVIVIMDAQTGRVRASVNLEGAYSQAMMPGSTMKPFTTLAALRSGLINEDSRTACPGRFTGLSFSLPCVHADHLPPFSPSQAIAYSCNFYFASLGQHLGRERLIETLRPFGFGEATGVDESEVAGVMRPCDTGGRALVRRAETHHVSEQGDCTARGAIGESDHIQVTPMQLLAAYTALLNGGRLFQPQETSAANFQAIERARINISQHEHQIISSGMDGAVRYGTARKARLNSLPLYVLGKTGTALPSKGFRNNGWFVGLAGPLQSARAAGPEDLKLAVLVFLPRAHGSDAAVLSRPVFEAYANSQSRDESPQKTINNPIATEDLGKRDPNSPVKVRSVSANLTQTLSMEDYVVGVMSTEGTLEAEPEALKALAVAIRTYAVKNRGRHSRDGFDFCSTTHCQRFGGDVARAGSRLPDAVRATTGQVLLDHQGQTADSYFGASCGGETANLGTLWGKNPPEYLQGVRDEFCVTGPHATWTDVISRADLLRALQSDARADVGSRLDQILITKHDESGRAEFIKLEGEQAKTIRGWDFKIIVGRVLGWNLLKSSRFEVSRRGSNFVFHGSGFGHGLGLCQEGAHVMAARGVSYERILEKYFPGTVIGRHKSVASNAASPPHSAVSLWLTAYVSQNVRGYASTNGGGASAQRDNSSGEASLTALCCGKAAPISHVNDYWKADIFRDFAQPRSGGTSIDAGPTERKAPPRFVTISSEHFQVTYPASNERRDADRVLTILESARADFLRRASSAVSISGLPTLAIRINDSTGDFVGRTGQPWWAAAATKGNRIELQPLPILKRRGVLSQTLRHELAHVIINIISRDRAPRWLEEGFAIYLAGEGSMYSNYVKRGAMTTDELEKRMQHPRSQQEMRSLYAEAYMNVSQLVRTQGEVSVWKKVAGS
jgi:SpoIID/LytB domain protein